MQSEEDRSQRLLPMLGADRGGQDLRFCLAFEAKHCGVDLPCFLALPLCTESWPKPEPESKPLAA